ncbi:MAG: Tm-1-like ATP-binding domain-containing protein [Chloroflexota bacterium]|nr:Tm-1-like ATP-binding domain-containing protein [Chloroflexota bacterium]
MATVLLIGTLDTKGPETAYLRDRVRACGCDTLVLDSGILGEAVGIVADYDRRAVAQAAGSDIDSLRTAGTRGKAVEEMLKGVRAIALDLHAQGRIHGVAALGGAEGSVLAAAACKVLPIGFPKLIVSPIASGQRKFAPFVGTKDVMVMHSVVDILGLNTISRAIFDSAGAAIAGMARAYAERLNAPHPPARPAIAATMLGNTTKPLMRVRPVIEDAGYDFVIFHANGVGGVAMEELIAQGYFSAVLDYTLSEIAGCVAGGFHNGGATRMDAAGKAGIPQVVVPGCLDFMVFGAKHEVPEHLRDRPTYYHNPEFTLVRLTADEQRQAYHMLLDKLNAVRGPLTVLVPLRGGSVMDIEGGAFWQPAINSALRHMLREGLRADIRYREVDAHINEDAFADATTEELLQVVRS